MMFFETLLVLGQKREGQLAMRDAVARMAKMGFLLLAAIFIMRCTQSTESVIERSRLSTVMITTQDKNAQTYKQGSGFFVDEKGSARIEWHYRTLYGGTFKKLAAVITNRHVLEGGFHAEIKMGNGRSYPVIGLVAEDKESDLAIIIADLANENVRYLYPKRGSPVTGERVIVIGNPLGLESTASDGIVSSIRPLPIYGEVIQISAPISHGSSGSPVIDKKGHVIGIASFGLVDGQNLNFAIPAERIAKLCIGLGTYTTLGNWTLEGAYKARVEGDQQWQNKEYESAVTFYKKAIKLDPGMWRYNYLGNLLNTIERFDEAIEAFNKSIQHREQENTLLTKYETVRAYAGLGFSYYQTHRYWDSISTYKQALRLDPDNPELYLNLGWSIYYSDEFSRIKNNDYSRSSRICQEAQSAFLMSLSLRPKDESALLGLGHCYDYLGNRRMAIASYLKALDIDPKLAQARLTLGIIYAQQGLWGKALEQYGLLKLLNKELAEMLFRIINNQ